MPVQWTVRAASDRENGIGYIALDNPSDALSQLDEIGRQTDRLVDFPKLGSPGRTKGTRELVVKRTSFIVVYQIKGEVIQILHVLHGSQKWF